MRLETIENKIKLTTENDSDKHVGKNPKGYPVGNVAEGKDVDTFLLVVGLDGSGRNTGGKSQNDVRDHELHAEDLAVADEEVGIGAVDAKDFPVGMTEDIFPIGKRSFRKWFGTLVGCGKLGARLEDAPEALPIAEDKPENGANADSDTTRDEGCNELGGRSRAGVFDTCAGVA